MSQAGRGSRGIGVLVEDPAISGRGGFELAAFFGKLGGKERIRGSFRRELQGFEQIVGCGTGIGVAIDAGECAPSTGFERGVGNTGIESGGGEQLRTRFGEFILPREEQAEGDVSLERIGVGGDGAAVENSSVVETILGVGDVAGVEEGARVSRMGGEVNVELGLSGLPVGCGDGRFGGGDFGGDGLRSCGCCGGRFGGRGRWRRGRASG